MQNANRPPAQPATCPASRYEAWYQSPQGQFALAAKQTLVRRMIYGWPRRGHNLLELFCASGQFLESFWEAGLDVSGQEQDQELYAAAHVRLGHRAELSLGSPEHLPYEDQSFDYVACLAGLEFAHDPEAVLDEVFRLATKGVLLAFTNRFSRHGLGAMLCRPYHDQKANTPVPMPVCKLSDPLQVWLMVRKRIRKRRLIWGSVLLGPAWSWRDRRFFRSFNRLSLPVPAGAFTALRVDLPPLHAGTGLLLPAKNLLRSPVVNGVDSVNTSQTGKPA